MTVITKRDAARRQLNAAIRLFFWADDPIVVHSLASTAANLYSDLVEQITTSSSWRKRFGNDGERAEREVRSILNHAWNFFKHADHDATEDLEEFDEEQSELILFYATLECSELEPTSDEMQLFQLWFLSTGRLELELSGDIKAAAVALFPNLSSLSRIEQVARGRARLSALLHANRDA
jgi:hypothetical protein